MDGELEIRRVHVGQQARQTRRLLDGRVRQVAPESDRVLECLVVRPTVAARRDARRDRRRTDGGQQHGPQHLAHLGTSLARGRGEARRSGWLTESVAEDRHNRFTGWKRSVLGLVREQELLQERGQRFLFLPRERSQEPPLVGEVVGAEPVDEPAPL